MARTTACPPTLFLKYPLPAPLTEVLAILKCTPRHYILPYTILLNDPVIYRLLTQRITGFSPEENHQFEYYRPNPPSFDLTISPLSSPSPSSPSPSSPKAQPETKRDELEDAEDDSESPIPLLGHARALEARKTEQKTEEPSKKPRKKHEKHKKKKKKDKKGVYSKMCMLTLTCERFREALGPARINRSPNLSNLMRLFSSLKNLQFLDIHKTTNVGLHLFKGSKDSLKHIILNGHNLKKRLGDMRSEVKSIFPSIPPKAQLPAPSIALVCPKTRKFRTRSHKKVYCPHPTLHTVPYTDRSNTTHRRAPTYSLLTIKIPSNIQSLQRSHIFPQFLLVIHRNNI